MSRALITGGAGFIGTNLAERLLLEGWRVTIFDNLSRPGVERNLHYLQRSYGADVEFDAGDVRDPERVARAVRSADFVFHFAAQVAVTTSLVNPLEDCAINIGGTLNVLEAIRNSAKRPPLVFTSTNKVYGGLDDLALTVAESRYRPSCEEMQRGISEQRRLDFHSPYGCSKGSADQYVLDYARSFGLAGVVFRMSCIYGPHQMGTEDQGWIAHFLLRALSGESISICGDGMQVRDILFVDDLVRAFLCARDKIASLAGHAFNMGGGPANTISLLELLQMIGKLTGRKASYHLDEWRAGDQRFYVSDTRRFQYATGWRPRINVEAGVKQLYLWLQEAHRQQWAPTAPAA